MEVGNENRSFGVDTGVGLHRDKWTFVVVERQDFSCTHSIIVSIGCIVTCSSSPSTLEKAEERGLLLLVANHDLMK
jgi:hypothetical protein